MTVNTKPIALLSMNKAPARPLLENPADAHTRSGQEDAKPIIQDYEFCVIILCFISCFAICVIDICLSEDP